MGKLTRSVREAWKWFGNRAGGEVLFEGRYYDVRCWSALKMGVCLMVVAK